jgi:hypothetical protein
LAFAAIAATVAGVQYSAQPPENYTGANGSTCSQCHGNFNTGGGGIAAVGLPVGGYAAGQSYDFSILLSHPSNRGRWGFSIAARDANNQPVGSFSTTNPNAAPNGSELSHFMAVIQSGTSFAYNNLRWTAPINPGPAQQNISFYFIGNAANGDFSLTGDFIYSGTLSTALLAANKAPFVRIVAPTQGSIFEAGAAIKLQAMASDSDGTVKKVEFFLVSSGLQKLGEDSIAPYELTGSNVEPGSYRVLAKATDDDSASTYSDTLNILVNACAGSGTILAEGFINIPGDRLVNLASSYSYPSYPDVVAQLNRFEYGPNIDDFYGARVRGYICAPVTGDYIFYISSDNQSELWLSTDQSPLNVRRIANVETQTGFRSYFSNTSQRSQPIRLIRGARYYIETVHKEGSGTDHLSVAWKLPGGLIEGPIPGNRLSPWNNTPLVQRNTGKKFEDAMKDVSFRGGSIVSPNPSSGSFQLTLNNTGQSANPPIIRILDAQGRILDYRYGFSSGNVHRFGESLKPGLYFVEIIQPGKINRIKIIKR